jgi:hypothetical protein
MKAAYSKRRSLSHEDVSVMIINHIPSLGIKKNFKKNQSQKTTKKKQKQKQTYKQQTIVI